MADVTLVDLVKITALTTGTGAVTLGDPVPGYRGVEALLDGAVYGYSIQQEAEYEVGRCTYLQTSNQIVRTPEFTSNGGVPINLQANASIAFVATAEDILGRDVLRPLYGYGAPTNNIGLIGQTYTDKNEPVTLYGPKTAAGWGVGVTLQGGPGKDGKDGEAGGNVMSTGPKTAAEGLVVPANVNQVITDSYSGDGEGQAPYVRNRGTIGDQLTKYPRFTFRSADLDAWEMPVRGPTILEAGGKPDGSDSIDAFEQARDWAFERGVNEIFVPNTRTDAGFRISRTLNIDCPVTIRGPSGGRAGADRGKAIIRVAKGQDGIVVHTSLTSPRQGDPRAVGGENTRLIGLMMVGDQDDLQTKGIRLRARAEVAECLVQYFGYSCYIRATAGLGGDSEGNANHWLVRGCRFDTPRQDCLYLAGGDANAGLAIDSDMVGANGWAVNNEAFLSNTFIALQSVACGNYNSRRGGTFAGVNYDSGQGYWYYVPTIGATPTQLANTTPGTDASVWTLVYKMANPTPPIWQSGNMNYRPGGPYASFNVNSSSMFLGCYSESDMGPSQFNTPAMCIAGTHAAGVIGGAFQYNRFGMVATPIGFVVYDTVTGRYVTLGGAVGDGILSEFYDPINFPGPLSLRMGSSGRIVMSGNGRGDGNEFYALHGNNAARPGHFELSRLYATFPQADNDAGAAASGVQVNCAYRKSDGTLAWRKA